MSLINEALKKAQRLRHEDTADTAEPATTTGGTRITKRGRAHSANVMVLLGSGAVVLIVLSVVATVYLVNRTPEPASKPTPHATAAQKTTGAEPTSSGFVAPKLEISVPSNTPATPAAATTIATAPIGSAPPAPPSTATTEPTPPIAPVMAAPAPIVIATPSAPALPDERVVVFVESIKVAGVRSSGNESRVLMNERVYRVNDIVERALGLKLIGVAAEKLTFTDPSGATYVKQF